MNFLRVAATGLAMLASATWLAGGQANHVNGNDQVSAATWIHTFTATQRPEDLRKALHALQAALWEGPAVKNAQGGSQRSIRKLDSASESQLAPWLEFYAALDNVEATMRGGKMPMVMTPGPAPASVMNSSQQRAYEEALLRNEDARKYWTTLSELANGRRDASSFFWTWAGGSLHDEPTILQGPENEALATGCMPARATWLRGVLGASKGTFPPTDDAIGNGKPVKPYFATQFPQYAPFKGADPNATHEVTVRVPTRVHATQENGVFVVRADPASFEAVTLKVGREMFTGVELDQITEEQGKKPETAVSELAGGMDVSENIGTEFPLPRAGKTVGLLIKLFETDTPPQHMWMPSPDSEKYRVLWSKEFTLTLGLRR
jgi:hypothetical protein